MSTVLIPPAKRGILQVSGPDRKSFLQGIMTQDINLLSPEQSLYTAVLNPQGKFLHDFFLIEKEDTILLEIQTEQIASLKKLVEFLKLRMQVFFEDVSALYKVFVCLQTQEEKRGKTEFLTPILQFSDPRLKELGTRWLVKDAETIDLSAFSFEEEGIYEKQRISLGVPEAGKDMLFAKSIPLESGLQDLNAISWTKGCYMGQELTARTRYRGEVRKRLFPIKLDSVISSSVPESKDIIADNAYKAGELYSIYEKWGIARLRLEYLNNPLTFNGIKVHPFFSPWIDISM